MSLDTSTLAVGDKIMLRNTRESADVLALDRAADYMVVRWSGRSGPVLIPWSQFVRAAAEYDLYIAPVIDPAQRYLVDGDGNITKYEGRVPSGSIVVQFHFDGYDVVTP